MTVHARYQQVFGAVVCCFCIGVGGGQAGSGDSWKKDVQSFGGRLVDAGVAPGMGVAVVRGNQVVFEQGFGSADRSVGRDVGTDTSFYIASSSKALTGTAVLLLAEAGKIDLNAPITHYIEGLQFSAPLDSASIRVEDLLTMSPGIDSCGPPVIRTAYTGEFTQQLLIELMADCGPSRSGRRFQYSNLPYNLLGMVLEAASPGQSWKEVVSQQVLYPLAMNHTSSYVTRLDRDRMAMPHEMMADGFARVPLGKADENMHAAGGHFASAGDLGRFVASFLDPGRVDGRQVLPAAPLKAAQQKQVDQDRNFGPYHRFGWGYGWDLGTYEGDTIVHRFGSFRGYRSHMSFMPEHELGVVVLVNGGGTASSSSDVMANYIYDRILQKPGLDEVYRTRVQALEENAAEERREAAEDLKVRASRQKPLPHPLNDYAGVYENPALGSMVWSVTPDGFAVRMGVAESSAEVQDAPASELRVVLTGRASVVTFRFPAEGGPAQSLQFSGFSFERVR